MKNRLWCSLVFVVAFATLTGCGGPSGSGGGGAGSNGGGSASSGGGTSTNGGGSASNGGGASSDGGGSSSNGGGAASSGGGSSTNGGGSSSSGGGSASNGGGTGQPATPPIVDLRGDVNRDGVVSETGSADESFEDTWSVDGGAVFLANIDDDTSRCSKTANDVDFPKCHDATDEVVNGDTDLLDLAPLKVLAWPAAPATAKGQLSVNTSSETMVRIFRPVTGGNRATAAGWAPFNMNTDSLTAAELRAGVELRIEAKDIVRNRTTWDGVVTVILTVTTGKANGDPGNPGQWDGGSLYEEVRQLDLVQLRVSPLMTFSHMTDTETLYATLINDQDSVDFRNGLQAALTTAQIPTPLVAVSTSSSPNGADQWTQDFFETGYMTMPGASGPHHMRVAIRSANVSYANSATNPLRPAGKIVFNRLRGPDHGGVQQFQIGASSQWTLDSFGNLETIPPFENQGVKYPLGRVIRGNVPSYHPDTSFLQMIEAQAVQPPIYVDTSWLLVAHIDETISFIPAPNTPRGWIMLVNDPRLAKTMLETEVQNGNGSAIVFPGMQTYNAAGTAYVSASRTISQVLADTAVMNESARSATEVDAQVAIIKAATGITDAEIVRAPYLHERVSGASVAYNPGTANGVMITKNVFAAPEPHGPIINGQDIFKAQLAAVLAPYNVQVQWVENWYLYHINLGEVHCGSNSMRKIPSTLWWESGR